MLQAKACQLMCVLRKTSYKSKESVYVYLCLINLVIECVWVMSTTKLVKDIRGFRSLWELLATPGNSRFAIVSRFGVPCVRTTRVVVLFILVVV